MCPPCDREGLFPRTLNPRRTLGLWGRFWACHAVFSSTTHHKLSAEVLRLRPKSETARFNQNVNFMHFPQIHKASFESKPSGSIVRSYVTWGACVKRGCWWSCGLTVQSVGNWVHNLGIKMWERNCYKPNKGSEVQVYLRVFVDKK